MPNDSILNVFSEETKSLISSANNQAAPDIETLIRAQEATDKSAVIRQLLISWAGQQREERKLRKIYSVCFIAIMAVQILLLNVLFILIGAGIITFSDTQANIFFVSVFAEIVSLVLIVTKYLFPEKDEAKILNFLKDI